MSENPTTIARRSLLTAAAVAGGSLLSVTPGTAQQRGQLLEIVSTEEAELYYEFVVRGEVEGVRVSEKIAAPSRNDAMMTGEDPEMTIVRGYTGNPGYGDAYRIAGELLFFEHTGGTSDYRLRLDGEEISPADLPQSMDPTTPEPLVYIGRHIDGVFGIKALEQGELYYELIVDGDVEGAAISDRIAAEFDDNDAVSTDDQTGAHVVRGFTGNPGYGDAFAIDGEVVAFRRDGGTAEFVFLLDGEELSVAALADSGVGFPTGPPSQDPVSAYQRAIGELERLGREIESMEARRWYNHVHGRMYQARTAIDALVEEGYSFRTATTDDGLRVEIHSPATRSVGGLRRRRGRRSTSAPRAHRVDAVAPLVAAALLPPIVLVKYAVVPALATLGAVQTAPYAASAISYLGGQIPTAAQALSRLFASRPSIALLNSSTVADPHIRRELLCLLGGNVASLLLENSDLEATARVIADRSGGCSVTPFDIASYAREKFRQASPDPTYPAPEVITSVVCGAIQNEWHADGQRHPHPHGYRDERYRFSRTGDDRVYQWVRMRDVPPVDYSFTWRSPSGGQTTTTGTIPSPTDGDVWPTRALWSYIDLGLRLETGEWDVGLTVAGDPVASESFTIRA
ncbi:hypothetical protein [Halobellus sp. GM3]|uniref:hypothetical protein n=1 Tax=Halobellus sp. GM3 TaxID=3458410 RepID=UPI00403E1D85